jgi:ATP synthase protein I
MKNRKSKARKTRLGSVRRSVRKRARKIKARNSKQGVWFGLGMMGLIGWSVVVPTLLGAALGIWLDNRHAGSYSWTLMLLVIGLVIGCLNAWHWVAKEDKEMQEDQEDNNDK